MCTMICYEMFCERSIDIELGEYISYGIEAFRVTDSLKETVCTVHDVFTSESKAAEFIKLCNELKLSPIHIFDAIQDAIG